MCDSKHVKKWLHGQINITGFAASAALESWLLRDRHQPLWNVGIVGGARGVLRRALGALAARVETHYASAARHRHGVVDMLVFNEVVLRHAAANRSVVGGYPCGGVNLPMFGNMCYDKGQCRYSDRNFSACMYGRLRAGCRERASMMLTRNA